jgi:ParB family chromosome partitioning protein
MNSNKTLGRGLSAFLDPETLQNRSDDGGEREIVNINVDGIETNPFQPRRIFNQDGLRELAESIKRKGVLQPILVTKLNNGAYQLIAGERRLRASQMAGLKEIPAIVTKIDERDKLEIAILENVQREDLNPIDEAEAYKRLVDEFNYTQDALSEIVGKSRSHITNILRLLSLPDDVIKLVKDGKMTFGHARAIVGSENASELAQRVVGETLNVRQTENIAKERKEKGSSKNKSTDPEMLNIENQISSLTGLRVNIKLKNFGGIVEMEFKNFRELDALLMKLTDAFK